MYADFESILEPMGPVEPGSPNPNQPYTNEVNQHTPSSWCVYSKFATETLITRQDFIEAKIASKRL